MCKYLLLLVAIPLFSAQVPVPIPGTTWCKLASVSSTGGASGSSRVTVDDIGECGINATTHKYFYISSAINGAVSDAGSRSDLNSHATGSSHETGLYRCALNVIGNSFDVFEGDCTTPVPNNATHVANTGMVWRVQLLTLRTGPIVFSDGGVIPPLLSGSAWKESGTNPAWTGLVSNTNAFVAAWSGSSYPTGCDPNAQNVAKLVQRWYGEGKPTSGGGEVYRDAAIALLANIEQYWPGLAWSGGRGSQADSAYNDYKIELYAQGLAFAIDWMWDELSGPQQAKVLAYVTDNDLTWRKGGHSWTDKTSPSWYATTTGTVSYSIGSATVSGSGTNFLTYSPGDVIYLPSSNVYGQQFTILSIASNVSLTLTVPVRQETPNSGAAGQSYLIGPSWDSSMAGLLKIEKHYPYTIACGSNLFASGGSYGCTDYPWESGQFGGALYTDYANNHTVARTAGRIALSFALANHSIQARWRLAEDLGIWQHKLLPQLVGAYNGIGLASIDGYNAGRQAAAIPTVHSLARTAFTAPLEFVSAAWMAQFVDWAEAQRPHGSPNYFPSQEISFLNQPIYDQLPAWLTAIGYPELPSVGYFKEAITRVLWTGWNSTTVNKENPGGVFAYLGHRGDVTATARNNTTYVFADKSEYTNCLAVSRSTDCVDRIRHSVVSNGGTAENTPSCHFNLVGISSEDHNYQRPENGLYCSLGGSLGTLGVNLLYHDGANYGANNMNAYSGSHDSRHFNELALSGFTLKRDPAAATGIAKTLILSAGGNSRWAAIRGDTSDHYTSNPGAVVRAYVHAKSDGVGFIVDAQFVPSSATAYYHYGLQNGTCGTASSPSCVTFTAGAGGSMVLQPPTTGKITTKWVAGTPDTETASPTNGSYTGGFGRTFRVQAASASGLILAVHRVVVDTGEAMPPITQLASGAFQGVQIEGAAPKVVLIAGASDSATASWTATASGTIQTIITGVTPGTVAVARNGSPVAGSPFTVGADKTIEFDTTAGTFTLGTPAGPSTWYVSTSGSSGNTGAIGSPWDFATAISSATTAIQPGDIVLLRAGTYTGHNVVTKSGSAGNPITYRPYQGSGLAPESVVFDRNALTDGDNASIKIDAAASYVTFVGLEFTNSNTDRRSAFDTSNPTDMRPNGFESFGHHVKLINSVIHDTGTGLSAWSTGATADDSEFYGNVIFGNGWQSASAGQRGHGHGIYMQNQATGAKTIKHNLLLNNFDHGMQAYGSGDTGVYISGFVLDGNTAAVNAQPALLGYDRQLLVGAGQFCSGNTLTNNNVYLPIGTAAQALNVGYLNSLFCRAFTLTGNYLIGGELRIVHQRATSPTADSTFTGNDVHGSIGWEDGTFDTGWGVSLGASGTTQSGNSQITVRPGSNRIVVQPNLYEANRCNVIIYNWTSADSVSVDLSTCLGAGVAYKVIDAQNWGGTPVLTGTYTSGSVSIPVNGTAVRTLIGANPGTDFIQPVHTDKEFNAFVVMRDYSPPTVPATYRGILRGKF